MACLSLFVLDLVITLFASGVLLWLLGSAGVN